MAVLPTTAQHEAIYKELCGILAKYAKDTTPAELLAISANIVGKVLAMQDQRSTTVEAAMQVIAKNIEVGNQMVVQQLAKGPSAGRA